MKLINKYLYYLLGVIVGLNMSFTISNENDVWKVLNAMIKVESKGNDLAYCAKENAVGCLQIRPIMVKEINRILIRQKKSIRYTLEDRWSRKKSIEMFFIWKNYHHKNSSLEKIARNWNGGPNGYTRNCTKVYWNKVKKELENG